MLIKTIYTDKMQTSIYQTREEMGLAAAKAAAAAISDVLETKEYANVVFVKRPRYILDNKLTVAVSKCRNASFSNNFILLIYDTYGDICSAKVDA